MVYLFIYLRNPRILLGVIKFNFQTPILKLVLNILLGQEGLEWAKDLIWAGIITFKYWTKLKINNNNNNNWLGHSPAHPTNGSALVA